MDIPLHTISDLFTVILAGVSLLVTHFVYKMEKRFSKIENMMERLADQQEDLIIQQRELYKQIQHQNEVMAKLEGQLGRMNGRH